MRKIGYIIVLLISFFSMSFFVYASCTNDEINELKKMVSDIKVTYKHLGKVENEEGIVSYNDYKVTVKNISNDLYISLFNGTVKIVPTDGIATEVFNSGTWIFEIYSNKCEQKIEEIEVFIPRFNMYSLDPLCEGIDGSDFALCGKYYEYDVSYESFKERVEHYRTTHSVENNNNEYSQKAFKTVINKIIDFIIKYKFYFIGAIVSLILFLVIIFSNKKRKKRGVLE